VLNVLTLREITPNLERHLALFEEESGAHVIVHGRDFGELYGQIDVELRSGENSILDAFIFPPQFLVDFTTRGEFGLEALTSRVTSDERIEWLDIFSFFRRFNSVGLDGQVYTIPLDGDIHALYYRSDILARNSLPVPRTWPELLDVARQLNGQDFNDDGIPDYPVCLARGRRFQAGYFLLNIAAPYLQRSGTEEGFMFDAQTMEPLVREEGFVRAVEIYMQLREYGPPLHWNVVEVMEYMAAGGCALAPSWANIGPMSRDTRASNFSTWDKMGVSLLPGTEEVWDRTDKHWIRCSEDLSQCPLADTDGVNVAPLAANGGWAGGIPAAISEARRNAAYAFLSFMSSPQQSNEDVLSGDALDPYRAGHFHLERWVASGFSEQAARNQIDGWKATLSHPNVAADLRTSGSDEYMNVILDDLLWLLNNGSLTQGDFVQQLYARWEGLTEELGRIEQRRQYRALIGLPPAAEQLDLSLGLRLTVLILGGVCVLLSLLLALLLAVHWFSLHFVYGNRVFLILQLLGALLTFCGALVLAAGITDATCQATTWLFTVGIFLIYLALILRSVRVYLLVAAAMKFEMRRLPLLYVAGVLMLAMLPVLVLLVVWQLIDPLRARNSDIDLATDTYTVFCACEYLWWVVALFGYAGVWLLVGSYTAVVSRSLAPALQETRAISLSAYNGILCGGLALLLALVLDGADAKFVVISLCALLAAVVPLLLSFVPKLYAIARHQEAHSAAVLLRMSFNCRRCGQPCQLCAHSGYEGPQSPADGKRSEDRAQQRGARSGLGATVRNGPRYPDTAAQLGFVPTSTFDTVTSSVG